MGLCMYQWGSLKTQEGRTFTSRWLSTGPCQGCLAGTEWTPSPRHYPGVKSPLEAGETQKVRIVEESFSRESPAKRE